MSKTINIKGAIISDDESWAYDWFGMPYSSPSSVANVINDADSDDGDGNDDLIVNIASNGGDVFAASEIYTALRANPNNVVVNIQGLAASAASVIAMAGDTVNISPTAQIMIHQASVGVQGNATDMTHTADFLSSIDQSIANAYEQKTGMQPSDLLNMMAQETWLTAQMAVDKGFADNIMFATTPAATNSVGGMLSKQAINKVANFLLSEKTKKPVETPEETKPNIANDISSLRSRKAAILLGK